MPLWYGDSCKVEPGAPDGLMREIANKGVETIIRATGGTAERVEIDYPHDGADRLAWKVLINHG